MKRRPGSHSGDAYPRSSPSAAPNRPPSSRSPASSRPQVRKSATDSAAAPGRPSSAAPSPSLVQRGLRGGREELTSIPQAQRNHSESLSEGVQGREGLILDAPGALHGASQAMSSPEPAVGTRSRQSSLSTQSTASLREANISPSLEAAFGTPSTGTPLRTTSTTSTDSSSRTLRGGLTPGKLQEPLKTPSYPFPYVPKSPVSEGAQSPRFFRKKSSASTQSQQEQHTPLASGGTWSHVDTSDLMTPKFMPHDRHHLADNDGLPETPNLYDLVLRLNAEPTLEGWWTALSAIMHENYHADRLSLTLPADSTDIENVPWGQKASFKLAGFGADGLTGCSTQRSRSTESYDSTRSGPKQVATPDPGPRDSLINVRQRPSIETRHSYAGYEMSRTSRSPHQGKSRRPPLSSVQTPSNISTKPSTRDASFVENNPTSKLQENLSRVRQKSPISDDENDNGAENEMSVNSPYCEVFPAMRGLDREPDPLIDSACVNQVLSRGKLVVITRDFSISRPNSRLATSHPRGDGKPGTDAKHRKTAQTSEESSTTSKSKQKSKRKAHDKGPNVIRYSPYEDHEQLPSSPWSQSPAPSPAIQQDPNVNPFFATSEAMEKSFEPGREGDNYSQHKHIEAIGVDSASSIVHLPLTHPRISTGMLVENRLVQEGDQDMTTNAFVSSSKAPLAILSVLSPQVPYPPNLIESLRHIAPHLATSFYMSFQNSSAQERVLGALHRSGNRLSKIPEGGSSGLGLGIESFLQFDAEDTKSSAYSSIASPSDYSGRSRHSPIGSMVSTPAGDMTMSQPDSYFDAKPRQPLNRSKSGGVVTLRPSSGATSTARPASSDHRSALRNVDSPRREKSGSMGKESKPPKLPDEMPQEKPEIPRLQASSMMRKLNDLGSRHSLLHSHGADFGASFDLLPAPTIPRTPSSAGHSRSASTSDVFDMPPPSERLLRLIIDSLPVQIFTANPNTGAVTWVNSKFLVYRGQTPKQVIEDPWETIHPDEQELYLNGWYRSLRTGIQFQHKVRLRRFDDQYRYFYVRAAPLKDKMQNVVHWVGTMIDLHDQHIAEMNAAKQQETAASESKYRALANSSPQIVFAATKEKGVIFCNSQWLAYSGQTEEQAKGSGFMDHVHAEDIIKCKLPTFDEFGGVAGDIPLSMPEAQPPPSSPTEDDSSDDSNNSFDTAAGGPKQSPVDMPVPQRKLSELASTGILRLSRDNTGKPSYSTEVRLRMASGEYRWHLVRVLLAESLIQAEQKEETWYGTCTDINDHKELEKTLKETMDAKSRFLSNMSHEIRTPLNGIHGMANFLIDSNLTPEQLDQVNVIRSSTEGLRDLINDILDLSKVEAGMITLNKDWLQVRTVIEEVNDLTSSLAIDKGIELNYVVEEDVPMHVLGDRFRFRQVLLNVIGNAIKFTNEGEVFIRCKLLPDQGLHSEKDTISLEVQVNDTGTGFTDKEAERLFKRFSQIDGSSTRQHGGTGLGLVISMQLVELHGGTMNASSIPGQGSTFTFTMRFGVEPDDKSILRSKMKPRSTPGRKTSGLSPRGSEETSQPSRQAPSVTESGYTQSPEQFGDKASPSTVSSGSSMASKETVNTGERSVNSSVSSLDVDRGRGGNKEAVPTTKDKLHARLMNKAIGADMGPKLYSILVVCPLTWARQAIVEHVKSVLSESIPYNIVTKTSLEQVEELMHEHGRLMFTHAILNIQQVSAVGKAVTRLTDHSSYPTALIVVSDLTQKREFVEQNKHLDYHELLKTRRLIFVTKPLKPSKFAQVFDPQKSRTLSTDHNQSSAQAIANTQKMLFSEMSQRLGNKGIKVLYVEDNYINQRVLLQLFHRISVDVDTVVDGIKATERVFSVEPGYYAIILLDLMMPNKDGYQTCKDIREWEKQHGHASVPIIALSANVLNDVWEKCEDAGFNSYITKPVEFKELSDVMLTYLDPEDPYAPMEFMKRTRSGPGPGSSSAAVSGGAMSGERSK